MKHWLTFVNVCALCAAAFAQAPVNNSQPGQATPLAASNTKPARLEGSLLDDRYSRPLKRGFVTLKPHGAGRPYTGETDDSGRFIIDNIEPGEYTVEARRDGYISTNWGRRGGIRMPRIFNLYSGQSILDLTFRLAPWSAVEGKIRFNDGEPAFGVPVMLYRKQYYRGKLLYQQSGSARTNDRGEYRIAGLTPGAYIIAAIYNKPVKPKDPDAGPNDIPANEWSYATTYYTSGESLIDAVPVKLESGNDLTGLDIFLRQVRAVRVKIAVTDSCSGSLSSRATLQLYKMDENGNPVVPVNAEISGFGGTFVIRGLGPGQYMVTATSDAGPPPCVGPLRDRRVLSIAEYPQDGIEMNLTQPQLSRFSVSFDSAANSNDLNAFTFHLEPKSGLPGGNVNLERPRGLSQFQALLDTKEEYDLIVDRKPADGYVKSPYSLNAGASRIQVSLKGATITGSVINDKREAVPGATITLIPDPAKDRFQRYAEAYANEQGGFSFTGLAPGKYIAVPWLDVPPCDLFNWDNLQACRDFGPSVILEDSQGKGLELVLKPAN